MFKIIFPLSSLMSFLENLKPQQPHNQLLTSIELSRHATTYCNLIRNPAVKFDL